MYIYIFYLLGVDIDDFLYSLSQKCKFILQILYPE